MNRILLVDASEDLQPLASGLQAAGYAVATCPSSEVAVYLESEALPDAVLINLTQQPGDAPVREPPAAGQWLTQTAAIAILTPGQVENLDSTVAVDDFLVWPAPVAELVARLRRVLWRRSGIDSNNAVRCGDLVMDLSSYRVFLCGRPLDLTYKEYELLRFLASHPDRVFTREALLNSVWGYDFFGGARTVDVHIRRLRSKLEDAAHSFIETVRNVGYRFKPSP